MAIRPGQRRNGTPLFIYHSMRHKFSGMWWEPREYVLTEAADPDHDVCAGVTNKPGSLCRTANAQKPQKVNDLILP